MTSVGLRVGVDDKLCRAYSPLEVRTVSEPRPAYQIARLDSEANGPVVLRPRPVSGQNGHAGQSSEECIP